MQTPGERTEGSASAKALGQQPTGVFLAEEKGPRGCTVEKVIRGRHVGPGHTGLCRPLRGLGGADFRQGRRVCTSVLTGSLTAWLESCGVGGKGQGGSTASQQSLR